MEDEGKNLTRSSLLLDYENIAVLKRLVRNAHKLKGGLMIHRI